MSKKYKNALVLMKAMPPHLGHLYLIDTAIDHSDEVHIIICHNKDQPIPGDIRFNCIKDIYSNTSGVTTYSFDDIGLPQSDKESPSLDEFYSFWVPAVYGIVEDLDVVFTSEDYGDDFARYLGIEHFLVDRYRKKYPISGTEIRNDPMKNWKFIPKDMRSFFIKKIAIVGPESVGKTTLVQNISSYFNTNFVPEYGRMVSENNPNLKIDDFLNISIGRQEFEDWLMEYSNKLIICDTEDIVTYTYSKMYCPSSDHLKYEDYFVDKITKSKYDMIILLTPDCDSVQDGTRMFIDDIDDRWDHYNKIKANLDRFGKSYVEVGGGWESRYRSSKKLISKLIYS